MNKPITLTGSYLQNTRHDAVSERYNVIQPSMVGEVMQANGFSLASLSTGKGRLADKVDFQRTLSRYRGDVLGDGLFLDLVYDSKHLGRGIDKLFIGIYRLVCTNGIIAGSSFFQWGIRHTGNTYECLDQGIKKALGQRDRLVHLIERMRNTQLDAGQRQAFADNASKLLIPDTALNVRHTLLHTRRGEDNSQDLWTVFNRVQENGMRGKAVAYQLEEKQPESNIITLRNMTTRQIKANTVKDTEFNSKLFSLAETLAA